MLLVDLCICPRTKIVDSVVPKACRGIKRHIQNDVCELLQLVPVDGQISDRQIAQRNVTQRTIRFQWFAEWSVQFLAVDMNASFFKSHGTVILPHLSVPAVYELNVHISHDGLDK